ncbi:MAG: hypothetical protein QOJ64_1967 [Acidobacteriota bacterium]|nr:hypothetical protein [Acidobacteriota bacterium]
MRLLAVISLIAMIAPIVRAQQSTPPGSNLTPFQSEIENQRRRLSSADTEERRDAIQRLAAMKHPASAAVAAAGLRDPAAIVRATSARAVLELPSDNAAALLMPLLKDRVEFVRQETAYALGETRSHATVDSLIALLQREKKDGVRGAAVVSLGKIGDERAVITLTELLGRRIAASGLLNRVRRRKKDENEFVRRAAAHSLGEIGSKAAIPALSAILLDEQAPDDVRREAAASLGVIGDQSAIGALRTVITARDPYLARIAYEALRKIAPAVARQPM